MLRVHALEDGRLVTTEGAAAVRPAAGDERIWVELVAPTSAETDAIVERLGVHQLVVEDALGQGHPPKLEEFESHLFVIAHTPDAGDEGETRKIAILLAERWIVTILRVPLPAVDRELDRVRQDPAHYLDAPCFLAHALLDRMTDGFVEGFDATQERLDEIEQAILEDPDSELMSRLLELRSDGAKLLRVVRGQRDVMQAIVRSDHKALTPRLRPHLRDVLDHILRVYDHLEGLREGVNAARDAYLSAVNNRLSEIMRVLTVIATIMMPLSLLAGIFGMNFEPIPGGRTRYGFWVALGVMGLIALGMLRNFRKRGWL